MGERDPAARRPPTPAREALEGGIAERTAVEDLPSREFVSEGDPWIARLAGRTSTGSAADSGAPLLHLMFYRANDPTVAVRETLLPGESIERLSEDDLHNAWWSARPATKPGFASEGEPDAGATV